MSSPPITREQAENHDQRNHLPAAALSIDAGAVVTINLSHLLRNRQTPQLSGIWATRERKGETDGRQETYAEEGVFRFHQPARNFTKVLCEMGHSDNHSRRLEIFRLKSIGECRARFGGAGHGAA